ncbi:MAG: NUDIX domain-containing protein [Planctomycetota bacterium]|nr:MAG: NUDIX domain-containing protein [Planctomycetota bacterium]
MTFPDERLELPAAYRFCPQCGHPNPQPGQSPLKCQACGFAVFFGPVAAVGGLIENHRGEILVVRRARDPGKGKWGLPGGFVDPYESAEQALAREVREETGLEITDVRFLVTFPNRYVYAGVAAPVLDLFFQCRPMGDADIRLETRELERYAWCVPDAKLLANMAFDSNRRAIELWKHGPLSRDPESCRE